MSPPTVSIIIAAHNTELYIARAIESALSQTITNIEVLVINDGSTDQTHQIASSFTDQRLKVLSTPENLGVSAARNRCLSEAAGNWIAVLDSDDWYAPNRLEELLKIAELEQADLIADDLSFIQDGTSQPWTTLIQESGILIHKATQIHPYYFVETGLYSRKGLHLGLSKPLYRRDFLNTHNIHYDETLKVAEDFDFDLKCLIAGASFWLVPSSYYFYRSRPGSLVTQDKLRHIDAVHQSTLFFFNLDLVKKDPKLRDALCRNLSILKENRSYYKVVQPLKNKNYLQAIMEMMQHPSFFVQIVHRLKSILYRRLRYFVFKDPLAYKLLHH
jgi:succinoglycan biosynthesis protein ExoO